MPGLVSEPEFACLNLATRALTRLLRKKKKVIGAYIVDTLVVRCTSMSYLGEESDRGVAGAGLYDFSAFGQEMPQIRFTNAITQTSPSLGSRMDGYS
jgi:hypothetical protein